MKKILWACVGMALSTALQAQVGVEKTDSIEMGVTYLNDVYYLLNDGSQKSEATNNWHIAFQTGGQTDGIRVNTATATGANDGTTRVFVYPNGSAGDWATAFDTSNYTTWLSLNNSDEYWSVGALNTTGGQFPDFGWGVYNMSTHIVTGDSLYLITYKLNGADHFKKLYVEKKQSGNWFFKFADLDGSNETSVELKSADYSGKNFIYYNLETASALDREPAAWDFVLTRYAALQPNGVYFPSTGILTNAGVYAAKASGKEVADLELADTVVGFADGKINVINYDWKHYEIGQQGVEWYTEDSLAYFILDRDDILWKVVFTAFGGSANGKTVFTKTQITPGTSVKSPESNLKSTALYPNPANAATQLVLHANGNETALVRLLDVQGKEVYAISVEVDEALEVLELNLEGLNTGVYFVQVSANGFQSTQKLVKN
ncbi:MAG: T9SS type A sorting domain-containing protein [Bacteroidota bacterium]|nr:T9SS type A sorting domain-containing protein [Bacteroidota bacterium]MDX5431709.1 T9SS type A sorting domain-containing protein [Bacteroidota bacterium]MDX5470424.1 T9SS type A sorting domain-containing protein [Bacteroidota bacterium]